MASEAWERRNARARELGYRNYYDYRVHGYGERDPGEDAYTGVVRSIYAGQSEMAGLASEAEGNIAAMHTIRTGDTEWDVIVYDNEGNRSYYHIYDIDEYEWLVDYADQWDIEVSGS